MQEHPSSQIDCSIHEIFLNVALQGLVTVRRYVPDHMRRDRVADLLQFSEKVAFIRVEVPWLN